MEGLIRAIAVLASVLVLAGFVLFALDELGSASRRTQDELAGIRSVDPTPGQERVRERRRSTARELIDDANDVLLAPFASLSGAGNRWISRGAPTLAALVVYGFGLGYLARYAHGRP